MRPTNEQIKGWIEEYLATGYGDAVKKRAWKGQYIRSHAPWNNAEDCYHEWLKCINDKEKELSRSVSFEELYNAVQLLKIKGIGDLTIYDTATMLGCPIGIYPEAVYLHAGAAVGAAVIGIEGDIVEKSVFEKAYSAFKLLEPIQIEDFLCIYKKLLAGEVVESPHGCVRCC